MKQRIRRARIQPGLIRSAWIRLTEINNVDLIVLTEDKVRAECVVDKNGFLIAMIASIANVHGGKAVLLLTRVLKRCFAGKTILADGAFRGEIIAAVKKSFG